MNEDWDCPTCGRPTPPEIDVECNCGMRSSHHLSVSAMCRILREVSGREAALIVERDKLKRMLELQLKISTEAVIELEARTAQRDAEHALADRLAGALRELCETLLADKPRDITEFLNKAGDALAAWKEARSE